MPHRRRPSERKVYVVEMYLWDDVKLDKLTFEFDDRDSAYALTDPKYVATLDPQALSVTIKIYNPVGRIEYQQYSDLVETNEYN